MDLYVKGQAPEAGSPQVPYEGWVVATAIHPQSGDFELLVSDESSGAGMKRLRRVPVVSVLEHRLSENEARAGVV